MHKTAINRAIFLVFSISSAANAAVIDFDDLSLASAVALADGYKDLTWSNFYAMNATTFKTSSLFSGNGASGFSHGMVSFPNVVYSGNGNPATFSSLNAFNFDSVYLTAAWYDGLIVRVTASLAGILAETTTFTVNSVSPILETLNWTNIDSVTFTTSGGTLHSPSSSIGGRQLVLDDLSISSVSGNISSLPVGTGSLAGPNNTSPPSSVPIPAAAWLFGSALVGFRLLRKRSKGRLYSLSHI